MQIFLSIIMTFCMFFGTGTVREKALSYKYQNGSWSGRAIGVPAAEVKNGLLYVGGEAANYPADSSVHYYVKPVVTTNRGTWFVDKSDTNSICIFRLDSRGFNIQEWNFSSLTFGAEKVVITPNDETQEIELEVTYPDSTHKGIITYHICYDPDDQPRLGCSNASPDSPAACPAS